MKSITGTALALSLGFAPTLASAAPAVSTASANPATSLSLSPAVRSGARTNGKSHLTESGGLIFGAAIVAGVAAILIIDGTNGNDNDGAPSSP